MAIGNEVRGRMTNILNIFREFPNHELTIQDIVGLSEDVENLEYGQVNSAIRHLTHAKSLVKTYAARGKAGVCRWKLAGKHRSRTRAKTETTPENVPAVIPPAVTKRLVKSEVLKAIKSMGPVTSADLADHFGVTNNAIRSHIEDLRKDGWTLTTAPAATGTSARIYTYGGAITSESTNGLVERCFHLTMALGECTVADLKKTLGLETAKAETIIKLTAERCKVRSEVKLYSK